MKQNESDRILKDNERLRLENEKLTDKADADWHKQKQAEQDAAYARSHMKIKEVEVERKVLVMIIDAERGLAQLLADMISQPIWSNVVYWIALALLFNQQIGKILVYSNLY